MPIIPDESSGMVFRSNSSSSPLLNWLFTRSPLFTLTTKTVRFLRTISSTSFLTSVFQWHTSWWRFCAYLIRLLKNTLRFKYIQYWVDNHSNPTMRLSDIFLRSHHPIESFPDFSRELLLLQKSSLAQLPLLIMHWINWDQFNSQNIPDSASWIRTFA